MAIAINATASQTKTTTGTSIVSGTLTTTQPNCLLLAFVVGSVSGNGGDVSAVTGGSLTWVKVKSATGVTVNNGFCSVYRTFAAATVSGTVTATYTSSPTAALGVVAFSGIVQGGTSGSAAIGANNSFGSGATPGVPTGAITTTGANSWIWAVVYDWTASVTPTVPAGQTRQQLTLHATNGDSMWIQSRSTSTTPTATSVTINDTTPTADNWGMVSVEILCASGDTPLSPMHRSGIPESHRLANF